MDEKVNRIAEQAVEKQIERISNRLTFGSLCRAFIKVTKNRNVLVPDPETGRRLICPTQQAQFVDALHALVLPDSKKIPFRTTPPGATKICGNLKNIDLYYRESALEKDAAKIIRENFTKYIFYHFDDLQRKNFLVELQKLISGIPADQDQYRLREYTGLSYPADGEEKYCEAVSMCIYWCFITPNAWKDIPTALALSRKPYDVYEDRHHLGEQYHNSQAVQMTIREDTSEGKVLYSGYSYERCLEYILEHSLILKRIDCRLSAIDMVCTPQDSNPYLLRRVDIQDYDRVRDFIAYHLDEYKEKKSWKEPLSEMVLKGLQCEKWTGYAYYNQNGVIVAYLDYKIRTDGDYELGTQLTAKTCRVQSLATSLINFFRFRFMNARFFTGTYEENVGMRRVFEKTGFRQHLFYDPETGDISNCIRERVDRDFPNDESKMTNSVYFYANSLLTETLFGAYLMDSKTKQVHDPDAD